MPSHWDKNSLTKYRPKVSTPQKEAKIEGVSSQSPSMKDVMSGVELDQTQSNIFTFRQNLLKDHSFIKLPKYQCISKSYAIEHSRLFKSQGISKRLKRKGKSVAKKHKKSKFLFKKVPKCNKKSKRHRIKR